MRIRGSIALLCISGALLAGCSKAAAPSPKSQTPAKAAATTTSAAATTTAAIPIDGPPPTSPISAATSLITQLGIEFAPGPNATSLSQPTFSQCHASFPSESARIARNFTLRGGSTMPLPSDSVESVAYKSQTDAAAAVTQIKAATSNCSAPAYTTLPPIDGLHPDALAVSFVQSGETAHLIVVRRGAVIAVIFGTDTVDADSTAETMSAYLDVFTPAAVGLS